MEEVVFKPWAVYLGTFATGKRGSQMVSDHRTRDEAEDAAAKVPGSIVGAVSAADIRKKYGKGGRR